MVKRQNAPDAIHFKIENVNAIASKLGGLGAKKRMRREKAEVRATAVKRGEVYVPGDSSEEEASDPEAPTAVGLEAISGSARTYDPGG